VKLLARLSNPDKRGSLLRMWPVLQLPLSTSRVAGPIASPSSASGLASLQVLAVRLGHVRGHRGVAAAQVGAHMDRHPVAFEETFDRGGGAARLDLLADQAMGTL